MGSTAPARVDFDDQPHPRHTAAAMENTMQPLTGGRAGNSPLESLDMRADPDAQATVTDFLDFTEYLPSDMVRSLTLVDKLDQTYNDASATVHVLTTKWGQLPSMPPEERPAPADLRAEISENLSRAVSSRVYAHAEAVRMTENVNRHYNRAKTILAKLQTMLENYPPPEEQKSPVASNKSPQMSRAPKITLRMDGQKVRRPRVPRITVPGEVLAPYDLNYDTLSSASDSSSEEDEESPPPSRANAASQPRIKLVKTPKTPKVPKTPRNRTSLPPGYPGPGISTSTALARLQPPPENAVAGTPDAPWLRLTTYELAKLRKRMKKNAAWAPSETMIARELKNLGRDYNSFKAAKQKAEEEGEAFEGAIPAPVKDAETGAETMPPGALSMETIAAEGKRPGNRRAKSKEAKTPKQDRLATLAAEEAEASARKLADYARIMFTNSQAAGNDQPAKGAAAAATTTTTPAPRGRPKKRKRDSVPEAEVEKPEAMEQPRQPFKRTKTETPVPHPQLTPSTTAVSQPATSQEAPGPRTQLTPGGTVVGPQSTTPIPVPIPGLNQPPPAAVATTSVTSPAPSGAGVVNSPPNDGASGVEASIPLPRASSPKKSTTPILPPVRETRKAAARKQEQLKEESTSPTLATTPVAAVTPVAESEAQQQLAAGTTTTRRPASRGNATSQEPQQQSSLAVDRPRRASTARNTPAPDQPSSRPASRRSKRPAPGVISRTNSGGNSAVGKRKAAPKKKSAKAANKKTAAGATSDVMEVEVDDEGNVIDSDEPRYCLCNRVSFGTMIQCDNMDVSNGSLVIGLLPPFPPLHEYLSLFFSKLTRG